MNELKIDLTGYDSDVGYHRWYGYGRHHNHTTPEWKLASKEEAQRAVKTYGLTRQCDKVDRIEVTIPQRVEGITERFCQFFLGPAARKISPAALQQKLHLVVRGREIRVYDGLDRMAVDIRSYLDAEAFRMAQREQKKKKEDPKEIVWGEPTGLFVPDIGTKMRLVMPWQTEVIAEYRNSAMIELLEDQKQPRYYRGDQRRRWSIIIQPGSVLAVDRVYIRQGKGFEDFSSLTFRLAKGATVQYDGQTFVTKKSIRFFSSLRFVNQLLVEVDLNSLPGQEKTGTHRK